MSQKEKARFIRWVAANYPEWADEPKFEDMLLAASLAWNARAQYAERINRNKLRKQMGNVK